MSKKISPNMGSRTRARAFAFQALYQFSVTHESADAALARIWESDEGRAADDAIRTFAEQLLTLAITHLDKIDDLIEKYAHSRALHRLPMVDLALIRLGSAELLYFSDVPPAVTINEIVELARAFSTEESPSFLNAVLDQVQRHRKEIPESQKVASQWHSVKNPRAR